MSVALISFCSFLSGVGSCAAFQAALKTGMLIVYALSCSTDSLSYPQLAHASGISHGLPVGSFRTQCLLLHSHCRLRIPR